MRAVTSGAKPAAGDAAGSIPVPSADIDTTVASVARVYDCFLGGKDNYAVDREVFQQVVQNAPQAVEIGRINRHWLTRAVRFLARSAHIDQFLDVGAGLPAAENTHQAAQRMNPDTRVVYVDNDPVVAVHGRALLEEDERTHLVMADLTDPDEVLDNPTVRKYIDFDRPLALIQCATIHHVPDSKRPWEIMQRYIDRLPSGSYLALTHFHDPQDGGKGTELARFIESVFNNSSMGSGFFRTRAEIESFFGDLDIVDPGIVRLCDWWPDGPRLDPHETVDDVLIGGVGRKP
ncbi:SAM-dependent methyltransferase [Pseudonocardia kunmingensis]|uniref:S-adenosyl methyltransferase n=1 Tax=Pseudonocardia kunmingensis TaxID=630975 RepID=A0A543CYD4_9PSEU|nr:S-adenosyl methyltransferase [Pseudonocardia kunmingensis]